MPCVSIQRGYYCGGWYIDRKCEVHLGGSNESQSTTHLITTKYNLAQETTINECPLRPTHALGPTLSRLPGHAGRSDADVLVLVVVQKSILAPIFSLVSPFSSVPEEHVEIVAEVKALAIGVDELVRTVAPGLLPGRQQGVDGHPAHGGGGRLGGGADAVVVGRVAEPGQAQRLHGPIRVDVVVQIVAKVRRAHAHLGVDEVLC